MASFTSACSVLRAVPDRGVGLVLMARAALRSRWTRDFRLVRSFPRKSGPARWAHRDEATIPQSREDMIAQMEEKLIKLGRVDPQKLKKARAQRAADEAAATGASPAKVAAVAAVAKEAVDDGELPRRKRYRCDRGRHTSLGDVTLRSPPQILGRASNPLHRLCCGTGAHVTPCDTPRGAARELLALQDTVLFCTASGRVECWLLETGAPRHAVPPTPAHPIAGPHT